MTKLKNVNGLKYTKMTEKEQENLIDLIVDVARNSCNDGFNEHNANREAEILVENLVKKCLHPYKKVVSGDDGMYCTECNKYITTF